jgi:hypothetical protein
MRAASTMRNAVTVIVRACAALAVMATLGVAQQPAATSDELNQAILRYAFRYQGGFVRLIPGAVPDDLAPNFYAPGGTRVLGTVILNSGAVVLATTNASADSVRAEYARALAPRGWKMWEARSRERGGFVERGGFIGGRSERPMVFCHDRAELHIAHRRRAAPPHDLQLEYREATGMCDEPMGPPSVRYVPMDEPRFPTLESPEPPPGRPTQRCFSQMGRRGGGGLSSLGTTVSTDLSPTELLRHYGRQLEASGWTSPGRAATPAVASGMWTRTDSARVSQVILEVAERTPGSGCYDVQMKVTR